MLLFRGATVAELPYAARSIQAMDLEGRVIGEVAFEVRGGRTVFRPVDGASSYRVKRRLSPNDMERLPI